MFKGALIVVEQLGFYMEIQRLSLSPANPNAGSSNGQEIFAFLQSQLKEFALKSATDSRSTADYEELQRAIASNNLGSAVAALARLQGDFQPAPSVPTAPANSVEAPSPLASEPAESLPDAKTFDRVA
jgi:hypothetical protein